jgi:predicted PhzF superfamily epimerase YddE/YHI9
MPEYQVLRVFCAEDGSGGNRLAVFLDGASVAAGERQEAAARIGFSETVFVDDSARGQVRIFTPAAELGFAGHPLVGTAWLLARTGDAPALLRPPAGEVPARAEGDRAWVAGRPEWAPPFEFEQMESTADVEALDGPPGGHDLIGAWAWEDEEAGRIRERVFPRRLGIDEDEATGAAAVALCGRLARPLTIRQGRGSVIEARPLDDGLVEVGGRVVDDGAAAL